MNMISTHLRANIIGYVALFVALSGVAYAAGLEPDSVKSRHIKDGQVKAADVAEEALGSTHVADASLTGDDVGDDSLLSQDIQDDSLLSGDIHDGTIGASDVGDGTLTGSEIADGTLGGAEIGGNALTGADIAESTLTEVPNATIAGHGGYGRASTDGDQYGTSCNPENSTFLTCASVGLSPSAGGRALVIGRFRASSELDSDAGQGVCRLGISTSGEIAGTSAPIGTDDETNSLEWVTLTGITGPLTPGNYSFGIDCNESGGGIVYGMARISAVMISPF